MNEPEATKGLTPETQPPTEGQNPPMPTAMEGNLYKHAERELRLSGLCDKDSDYEGALAECTLELIKVFAEQGHSGGSGPRVISLFSRLASFKTLTPLGDILKSGEYVIHDEDGSGTLQSTRRSSVFSSDGGQTWYDINRPKPWYTRWMFRRQHRFLPAR